MTDRTLQAELEARLQKSPVADNAALARHLKTFFCVGEKLGYRFSSGDRVLDLGCEIGDTVTTLLDQGADAFGVDVVEYWGFERGLYWKSFEPLPSGVTDRLRKVDSEKYVIPFDDGFFDFCISSQVLEHIFNYRTVFAELGRVLKPGALSLHLFPGPWSPIEAHINVPIIPLCRHRGWLTLWAWAGRRSERQKGMAWREVVETNELVMRFNNYPSRRVLREAAAACGLRLSFEEPAYIACSESRPNKIMKRLHAIKLGWAAAPVLRAFCQRMVVIWKDS